MPIRPVALISLILMLLTAPMASAAGAEFVGRFVWNTGSEHHGGYSGFELDATGTGFVALSDRGWIATGTLTRKDGIIDGASLLSFNRLRDPKGNSVPTSREDAEGLTMRRDGRLYVSFEGYARVWTYASAASKAAWIPRHPDFAGMQGNSSLEALAIAPDGSLYTLPERSGERSRPFPVYRWNGRVWSQPFTLPRRGDYLPVGADFGPDGRFYLLERRFSGIIGFSSRVRRFDIVGNRIGNEQLLLTTGNLRHDNLEGLAVWRNSTGDIRLTMISDDNFSIFQTTEIVEYRVTE
jgi:hypothetical protein